MVRDASGLLHAARASPRGDLAPRGPAHRAPEHVGVPSRQARPVLGQVRRHEATVGQAPAARWRAGEAQTAPRCQECQPGGDAGRQGPAAGPTEAAARGRRGQE